MNSRRRDAKWKAAKFSIGLLISIACVTLGAWQVDWAETVRAFGRVRPALVLVAVLFLGASFVFFALRWRCLVEPTARVRTRQLFGYLMMSYMTNAVLPLRPGDFLRIALLRSRHGVPLGRGLSGIVIERLLDVLTVVAMGILVATLEVLPPAVAIGLYTFAGAGVLGLALMILLSLRPELPSRLGARFASGGMAAWLLARLRPFFDGLGVLHEPGRIARMLTWDALAWASVCIFMACLLGAMQIDVPPIGGVLVVVAVGLGAAIPSSPGAIGVFHALAVLALTVWNVPTPLAVAFAVVAHAIAIAMHLGLGAVCASVMGVHDVFGKARAAGVDAQAGS